MTAPIEVLAIRRCNGQSALKAVVDLKLGAITIRGARLVQQSGGPTWLAMPQTAARRRADGGGAGWSAAIEISSKDLCERLTAVVLAAYQEKTP